MIMFEPAQLPLISIDVVLPVGEKMCRVCSVLSLNTGSMWFHPLTQYSLFLYMRCGEADDQRATNLKTMQLTHGQVSSNAGDKGSLSRRPRDEIVP